MRKLLQFTSILAVALILLATLATVLGGDLRQMSSLDQRLGSLDVRSALIGVVLGFILAQATRVSWMEIPRRVFGWLMYHERNFYRAAIAAMIIGFLVYY